MNKNTEKIEDKHKRTGAFGLGEDERGGGGGWGKGLGGCGADFLARKIYAMHEYQSVQVGMQKHSNCIKDNNVHNSNI